MYEVLTLNKIAKCGLDMLDKDVFSVTEASENPDAIILRSFNMHNMEIPKSLMAVARAGAGVNNKPIDKMSELGIPVFNTPGANANAVAEMTLAGLLLASRKITASAEWAKTLKGQRFQDRAVCLKEISDDGFELTFHDYTCLLRAKKTRSARKSNGKTKNNRKNTQINFSFCRSASF